MPQLPPAARFAIVVLSSFSLSAVSLSLISTVTPPELAAVSRNLTDGVHIAAMIAWKLSELSVAWWAKFDYLDLAYLTLLNQVPHYFLLNTFFGIDFLAAVLPLAVDVLTIAIPFALMRNLNAAQKTTAKKTENQLVAEDKGVQYTAGLLGASVYALVVYSSFATFLPVFMVTRFDGVRSLEKVHSLALLNLLALFIPLGWASSQFIFVPAVATNGAPGLTDKPASSQKFDPATASIRQTLANNFLFGGHFTPKAEIIFYRTATLAIWSGINTLVRSYFTIEGTEFFGALGWSLLWAGAAASTGVAFALTGNE